MKKEYNFEDYGNKGICKVLQRHYKKWLKENEFDEDEIDEIKEYVLTKTYKTLNMTEDDIDEDDGFIEELFDEIIITGEYENCLECDDFDI